MIENPERIGMEHQNYSIPPMPLLEIKMEQEFLLRRIEAAIEDMPREDLEKLFIEQQRYIFILQNNVANLVKQW